MGSRALAFKVIFSTLLSVFALVFGAVPRVNAAVWNPTETWNEDFESRYAEWLTQNFDERFFLDGPWGGMKTDCADAVYGSRIIFSYLNSLPFVLSTKDTKFSHQTTAFDHISDPHLRVRAFIDFVNDRTWTGSLSRHTYPVALRREAIRPGVIWMKPGHVETVIQVRATGVVDLRGSWLPGAIRKMITITTLGHVPRSEAHGFRRWIWPQNLGRDLKSQPGYDDAQFAGILKTPAPKNALDQYREIAQFEEGVRRRLAEAKAVEEKPVEVSERLVHDFCALVESRSEVVRDGYEYSSKVKRCLNEKEYHAYSTPSRDSNLRRVVIGIGLLFENDLGRVRQALRSCAPIEVDEGVSVRAEDFYRRLLTLDFSSDPHDRPAARFGFEPPAEICASY